MSEEIAEVVAGLVTKRGKNGRCTYSPEAKRALAELCSRPGVSVARTALTHGVNANLLRGWIVQYWETKPSANDDGLSKAPAAALLPVTTRMPRAARAPMGTDSFIEMVYAAATIRVHGAVDARVLSVVLDCLAPRAFSLPRKPLRGTSRPEVLLRCPLRSQRE